jgi:hypothetical protein
LRPGSCGIGAIRAETAWGWGMSLVNQRGAGPGVGGAGSCRRAEMACAIRRAPSGSG